jgi:arylsulfatase A-like enzyme
MRPATASPTPASDVRVTSALAATVAGGPQAVATKRPNILLINTDDQRFDTMKFMPKTVSWMKGAHVYDKFQVAIPSCCPSRADLISGRFPHNDGVRHQADALNLDMSATMEAYLRTAGYRTAMAGKFLNSWPPYQAPPSFDRYAYIKGGYDDFYAYQDGKRLHVKRTDAAPRNYSTTWLADQLRGTLKDFATQTPDKPWFAYYAPYAPHMNPKTGLATPEPKYAHADTGKCIRPNEADRSDKPAYVRWRSYNAAEYTAVCQSQIRTLFSVDDADDDIFKQLNASGQLANTLVIFTSDNGYLWGEHGLDSKFVPYLESVRVPMLLRWDGHVTAGVDHRLASTVDIAPTLLQAAGIKVPAGKPAMDGRSMFGAARASELTEYWYDAANSKVPTWAALYNGKMHYIESFDEKGQQTAREYYDLVADPAENTNLMHGAVSTQLAATVAALHRQLTAARTCKGTGCP